MMIPFTVKWSDEVVDTSKAQVRSYRLPEPPDDCGWSYGCDPQVVRELCAYWVDRIAGKRRYAGIWRASVDDTDNDVPSKPIDIPAFDLRRP
jgi:hypothetical protein